MAAARPCPLRRRKLRASTAGMRPNGGRKAVPVTTQEVTGIDSRDATGRRPQGRARYDVGSYGHRQQRCDRMAAVRPCPLRRRKLRASTAEMRPEGGRKAVPYSQEATPVGSTPLNKKQRRPTPPSRQRCGRSRNGPQGRFQSSAARLRRSAGQRGSLRACCPGWGRCR